jgi:hypothetical protein
LPALRAALERQGWAVTRRGDTFTCKPAPLKTQKPRPPGKRLLQRVLSDAGVGKFMELFDGEIVDARI